MPRILVHFYGYKSKELPHAVKSLLSNSSGQNDIDVVVFDQLNLERREKFENVEYNYIHWDNLKSRFSYLNDSKSKDGYDFFLYVARSMARNFNNVFTSVGVRCFVNTYNYLINYLIIIY